MALATSYMKGMSHFGDQVNETVVDTEVKPELIKSAGLRILRLEISRHDTADSTDTSIESEYPSDSEWEMEFQDTNAEIHALETKTGMTSNEFYRKWLDGLMPDTFENNAWAILIDSREVLLKNKP